MKKYSYSKLTLALCPILLSCIALSGCSDSDHKKDDPAPKISKATMKLAYDGDHSGIPDVFEDHYTKNDQPYIKTIIYSHRRSSNKLLAKDDNDVGSGYDDIGVNGYHEDVSTVPVRISSCVTVPYEETVSVTDTETGEKEDRTSIVRESDKHAVRLDKGVMYTITMQDPNGCGGYVGDFNPNIRVVSQTELTKNDNAAGLKLSTIHVDPAMRSMSLSFTPDTSEIYYIIFSDSDSEVIASSKDSAEKKPYCFMVYPETDKSGHNVIFTSSIDGKNFTYTSDEIHMLRAALAPYVLDFGDNGLPSKFTDEKINGLTAEEAFNKILDIINSHHESAVTTDEGRTKIEPTMIGFTWDKSTFMGDGVSAVTGMPCRFQSGGVLPFDLELRDGGAFTSSSKMTLIDNTTTHEEALGIKSTASVAGARAAFSDENTINKSIKYSGNTTTLMLSYSYSEENPRRLKNLKSYVMNPVAFEFLKLHGEDEFRRVYGDYFVGGATYGARYVGTLVIRTSSCEKMTEIKNKLNVVIGAGKFGNEITKTIQDITNECDIELNETAVGESYDSKGDDPTTGSNAIATMMNHYESFKSHAEDDSRKHKFNELDAYLVGFNQITGGESMSDSVNLPVDAFTEVRTLCSMFLTTQSTVGAYLLNPDEHFANGESYKREIDNHQSNLRTKLRTDMDKIAENKDTRDKWLADIKAERDAAVDRTGRYQLYRLLEDAASAMGTGSRFHYGSWGVQNYYRFPAANADIDKSDYVEYNKGWHVGHRSWDPTFEAGENHRFCYFRIGDSQGHTCTGEDKDWNDYCCPPLTRSKIGFHVYSGYDRGLYLGFAWSSLNAENYTDFAWTY